MKVLYATDGSEGARIALDFLLAFPLSPADEVRVLAVPVLRSFALAFGASAPVGSVVDSAFRAADELAANVSARIARRGVRAEPVVRSGPVTTVILKEADVSGADLIVVGSRGLGVLRGAVLGSTARWLAQHCPIPVLVVRERRVAPARVLLAVDRVDEVPATRLHLNRLRLDRTEIHEVKTRDAATILDAANALGADLVVLGSDRMTVHDGLFVASVAGEVLARAHCAVLLAATPAMNRRHRTWQTIPA